MPTVKDLRDRIRSLKNTQQITKAMKQVAAAKIRRAEAAQKSARPYADALAEMLGDLIAAVSSVDHPFMRPGKEGAPAGIVLISSDKGLAGAFNSNVIAAAERVARERKSVRYYTIGVKARNAARRWGMADHRDLAAGLRLEDRHRARGGAPRLRRLRRRHDLGDRPRLAAAHLDDVATPGRT